MKNYRVGLLMLVAALSSSHTKSAPTITDAFMQTSFCKVYKCVFSSHQDSSWTYIDKYKQTININRKTSNWTSGILAFGILVVDPDAQYIGDDNKEFKALQASLLGKSYASLNDSCYTDTGDTNKQVLSNYSNKGSKGEFYCLNGHYNDRTILAFGLKVSQ